MQCPLTVVPWEAFFLEGPEVGSRLFCSQNNFTKSLLRRFLDYNTNIFQHEKLVDFHAHLNYETPVASYFRTATSIGNLIKIFLPGNHFDFRPRKASCIWTPIRLLWRDRYCHRNFWSRSRQEVEVLPRHGRAAWEAHERSGGCQLDGATLGNWGQYHSRGRWEEGMPKSYRVYQMVKVPEWYQVREKHQVRSVLRRQDGRRVDSFGCLWKLEALIL